MLLIQETLFSENECNEIINIYLKNTKRQWDMGDRKYQSYQINYNEETKWIFDKLYSFFEIKTGIKLKSMKTQIHFHKYEIGDWFDIHDDTRQNRLFTVGTILNNKYDGGILKLYNPDEFIINNQIGNSYIFDVKIKHEVLPVLDGIRYSILWFLQEQHFEHKINKII